MEKAAFVVFLLSFIQFFPAVCMLDYMDVGVVR